MVLRGETGSDSAGTQPEDKPAPGAPSVVDFRLFPILRLTLSSFAVL
jgi:hypothetical protein